MVMNRADRHPALNTYLRRLKIDPPADRVDGAVALVFREGLRITFHPVGRGDLVLEARIADLSGLPDVAVEQLCKAAIEGAGQRPWEALDGLALSADGGALQLHHWVSAECPLTGLEQQIEAYLAAVLFWRGALEREAA